MRSETAAGRPQFSIVTPVHDPPESAFRSCIDSVLGQTLQDWEWCLADDASTLPYVDDLLRRAEADPRVRVVRRSTTGGIVDASNAAASMALGEFLCLLDHDDLLSPDALASLDTAIREHDDVDYLYSDEDKVSENGDFYDRFFKPDWSPERLRGQNYCSHLSAMRRSLFEDIGGFRPGFDGSQDYDLILRITERARRIVHIPEVLYHWRAVVGSTATEFDAKPYAFDAAVRAIDDHLTRVGIDGHAEKVPGGYYRIRRELAHQPLVSIIIPTNGSSREVWGHETCLVTNSVQSLVDLSSYPNFEVVVVYDSSTPDGTMESISELLGSALVPVEYTKPFDFADKINQGVIRSSGDIVLMLNDDTEVVTPRWLEEIVGLLDESDVGMVGPKLLFDDRRVQSAGHYNDPGPTHLAAGINDGDHGPFGLLGVAGERSGLTGACAALRRDVFDEVGGLSLEFPNSFNDVDLGFKLRMHGYRLVWTPFATLHHFESLSRDPRVNEHDVGTLYDRWGWMMCGDPFVRDVAEWWTRARKQKYVNVDAPNGLEMTMANATPKAIDRIERMAGLMKNSSVEDLRRTALQAIDYAHRSAAEVAQARAMFDGAMGTIAELQRQVHQLQDDRLEIQNEYAELERRLDGLLGSRAFSAVQALALPFRLARRVRLS